MARLACRLRAEESASHPALVGLPACWPEADRSKSSSTKPRRFPLECLIHPILVFLRLDLILCVWGYRPATLFQKLPKTDAGKVGLDPGAIFHGPQVPGVS